MDSLSLFVGLMILVVIALIVTTVLTGFILITMRAAREFKEFDEQWKNIERHGRP